MTTRKRIWLAIVIVLAAALVMEAVRVAGEIRSKKAYYAKIDEIQSLLRNLHFPDEADRRIYAWNDGEIAILPHVTNSLHGSSFEVLLQYHQDLKSHFANDKTPTLKDLEWVWARIPRTQPQSARTIKQLQPDVEERLAYIRKLEQARRQASEP